VIVQQPFGPDEPAFLTAFFAFAFFVFLAFAFFMDPSVNDGAIELLARLNCNALRCSTKY
jgi:hypothetical protein